MKEDQDAIVYEPHPVSPERKAELRAQGYRIIDARFAPPMPHEGDSPVVEISDEPQAEQQEAAPARRGRKPKTE